MNFVKLIKSASNYISIDQLADAIDNKDEKILSLFEADWIGQGYGYKSNKKWEDMALDEVIYIPESGYDTSYGDGSGYPIDALYSKQDFIDMVGEKRAPILFESVDWQSPDILCEEWDWITDYHETENTPHEGVEPQYDEEGHYIPRTK